MNGSPREGAGQAGSPPLDMDVRRSPAFEATGELNPIPPLHRFTVLAVWPNGHGKKYECGAHELHGLFAEITRGGALPVVVGYRREP